MVLRRWRPLLVSDIMMAPLSPGMVLNLAETRKRQNRFFALLTGNHPSPGLWNHFDKAWQVDDRQPEATLKVWHKDAPALIRSGRVELWLEMKLPDVAARQAILRTYLSDGVLALSDQEFDEIAVQSEGFTSADLRRLAADARNLMGYDMAREQTLQPVLEYCMKAIRQLQKFREEPEQAPAFTAAHHGKRARMALEDVG